LAWRRVRTSENLSADLTSSLLRPLCYISNSDRKKAYEYRESEAVKLITRLPEEVSWDDIMYRIYVKRKIEEGVMAADEGRTISHEEVKELFGINEN
jgi:hypothetical protein